MRKAVGDPDDPRHPIYLAIQRVVMSDDPAVAGNEPFFAAIRASLLYQLTGQPEHARRAYHSLRGAYASSPNLHESEGRTRAAASLGLAYTWDWTRGAEPDEDRAWLKERIQEMLAAWSKYQHAELIPGMEVSSLNAVCRGSELVLLLAAGEETRQNDRYQTLKRHLLLHMQRFDEIGVSPEGSAYPADGGPYLLRALLALRDVGDVELEAEAAKHPWWRQAMYAGAFSLRPDGSQRNWLMSGLGGPSTGDAGWASLLLGFAPQPDLPYFLWWYEHHIGGASPGDEGLRYGPQDDGLVWALLLYPEKTPMLDPTGVFSSGIGGASGQILLRNRWRNRSDIQIAIHAGSPRDDAFDAPPETFRIQVLAHGENWIGSAAGTTRLDQVTALLVDGQVPTSHTDNVATPSIGGSIRSATFWPDGAYVVLDGGTAYRALGGSMAERHVLVHFHPASDDLILTTLDRIESDNVHTYTWQLNPGEPGETRRVVRDRSLHPFVNQPFVFVGGGWPLCSVVGRPVNATQDLKTEYRDPVRVSVSGARAEIQMELHWRCSGGAIEPNSKAIIEAPRLPGRIVRTVEGGLALERR